MTKLNGSGNGCDYYKVADYEFVNKYCYGNMVDYDINPITGEVYIETKHTLNYMKLFPYVLFGLALLGGLPKLFWLVTESKRAARTSYLLDGVDALAVVWLCAPPCTTVCVCHSTVVVTCICSCACMCMHI